MVKTLFEKEEMLLSSVFFSYKTFFFLVFLTRLVTISLSTENFDWEVFVPEVGKVMGTKNEKAVQEF